MRAMISSTPPSSRLCCRTPAPVSREPPVTTPAGSPTPPSPGTHAAVALRRLHDRAHPALETPVALLNLCQRCVAGLAPVHLGAQRLQLHLAARHQLLQAREPRLVLILLRSQLQLGLLELLQPL